MVHDRKSQLIHQTSLSLILRNCHSHPKEPPPSSVSSHQYQGKNSTSKKIMTHWRLRWWLAFFSNKVFLIKVSTFFKIILFIYLFLAVLGLHCCAWAFSSCSKWGLFSSWCEWASHCGGFSCFGAGVLGTWASVVAAPGLRCPETCGVFPRPGIGPVSPALAGGSLTTVPPGSPISVFWRLLVDPHLVRLLSTLGKGCSSGTDLLYSHAGNWIRCFLGIICS